VRVTTISMLQLPISLGVRGSIVKVTVRSLMEVAVIQVIGLPVPDSVKV